RSQSMPGDLSIRPEVGHDLVKPGVGRVQGLVEYFEAGCTHGVASCHGSGPSPKERPLTHGVPNLIPAFLRHSRFFAHGAGIVLEGRDIADSVVSRIWRNVASDYSLPA